MNDRATAFRSLFQRLVLASAMPIAGCGTTIIHVGSDAAPTDSPDATPPQDAPPTDRTEPTDRGNCARQPGPAVTCSQDFTFPCNDPPRLATGEAVGRLRGRWFSFGPDAVSLMVTFHPSYLLRAPEQKALAWRDLAQVAKRLRGL